MYHVRVFLIVVKGKE